VKLASNHNLITFLIFPHWLPLTLPVFNRGVGAGGAICAHTSESLVISLALLFFTLSRGQQKIFSD
jgi:hypothetical protein